MLLPLSLLVACHRPSPDPTPPPALSTAPIGDAAPTPVAETRTADPEPAPPPPSSPKGGAASAAIHWFLRNTTRDGKLALLERNDSYTGAKHHVHFRVVEVATNKVVDDLDLEHIAALPRETMDDGGKVRSHSLDKTLHTAEVAADLARAAKAFGRFPFGSAGRIAASADGSVVAFNAGDWIYVADGKGAVKKRVAEQASYRPRFSPDGKWLFFDKMTGPLDNVVSKYETFVVPSDLSTPPRRLEGTAELREEVILANDDTLRGVVSAEPIIKTCLVSIAMAPPHAVKKGPCFEPPNGRLVGFVISPSGAWAGITTARDTNEEDPNSKTRYPDGGIKLGKKQVWSTRILRAADGKTFTIDDKPGKPLFAVNDDGLAVRTHILHAIHVDDVPNGKHREHASREYFGGIPRFRSAKELVYETAGSVRVFDVDAMR